MILFLKEFLVSLVIFLAIDFVWLGLIAKRFYDQHLADFDRVLRWPPAILTYLFLVAGIVFFVFPRANFQPVKALFWGAVFGVISYGVYDLTNLATLAKWSPKLVLVDLLWGAFLCGMTGLISLSIIKKWL